MLLSGGHKDGQQEGKSSLHFVQSLESRPHLGTRLWDFLLMISLFVLLPWTLVDSGLNVPALLQDCRSFKGKHIKAEVLKGEQCPPEASLVLVAVTGGIPKDLCNPTGRFQD